MGFHPLKWRAAPSRQPGLAAPHGGKPQLVHARLRQQPQREALAHNCGADTPWFGEHRECGNKTLRISGAESGLLHAVKAQRCDRKGSGTTVPPSGSTAP
jgi:hypothetical protein